ncbi:MAG: nucleotidyl transferase AbiEii/AbiGii toxin family protein [Candidatus Riflebacteria bacterium]|nr:nucleotidyl transferase AbiEii/AbiGii toxin family protein [Candidatus Riflebacteria bacterium]
MISIESIKGKIRNLAKESNLSTQELLQMYFFERLLERISKSKYKMNFVVKGGLLISSIIGVQNRTTMDMDASVKGIALKEEKIKEAVDEILSIEIADGITFEATGLEYIREADEYDNFRVSLLAKTGKTKNPMKMDITTGDPITPKAVLYKYPCIFHEEDIEVLAYPIETIIAEKYETVIRRNIATTRMRDFYDIYVLFKAKEKEISFEILKTAIIQTATKRGSLEIIEKPEEILKDIREYSHLKDLWEVYAKENRYVGDLHFEEVLEVLVSLAAKISI